MFGGGRIAITIDACMLVELTIPELRLILEVVRYLKGHSSTAHILYDRARAVQRRWWWWWFSSAAGREVAVVEVKVELGLVW
jgi:hypothetical protein